MQSEDFMASNVTPIVDASPAQPLLAQLVNGEGSARHPYLSSEVLRIGRNAARNLADVIHHLTLLHGRHPGVVDQAALHTAQPEVRDWRLAATDGFARERSYLTKLAVAIGPLPSTPGQAETESAVLSQRHALEMLAQSDRVGCAFGAAAALVMDWNKIRILLDFAADRLGVDVPQMLTPSDEQTEAAAAAITTSASIERAIGFGAQQLLVQHRGLWDLMQARQIARGEH
jgi:hypothetical protein